MPRTILPSRKKQPFAPRFERSPRPSSRSKRSAAWSASASVLVSTGPTTGLVVGGRRLHHFQRVQLRAAAVVDPGHAAQRRAGGGQIVARDHSRMLVLLKVNTSEKLAVPGGRAAQRNDGRPVGDRRRPHVRPASSRTFRSACVSATNRIWGKAIQTDAKISPANYGGPLVDIRGRVLGVLVPLSPQGKAAKSPASNGTTRASASPCRWPT